MFLVCDVKIDPILLFTKKMLFTAVSAIFVPEQPKTG